MFEHSVKVPRLYKTAAKVLQDVTEKGNSLKQLIYQCKHRNLKAVYALVAETIKHFTSIDSVIEQSQLLEKENRLDPWLARILITEMLWRGKQLPLQAKPLQTVNSYYDILKQHKEAIESNTQATDVMKVQKPRFARINTLKMTLQDAMDAFREEGWTLTRYPTGDYDEFIAKSASLGQGEFLIDIHIKELLLFSSDTQFYNHRAYKDSYILLQDKASCLASHLLNPTPGSTVLDMCAAPGMKTTHIAALLNNEGVVYAVEMNQQRFNVLNKIVQNSGATCVKTIHKDAVSLTAKDCPNVEYILIDPSCSGSGMMDRITIDGKQEEISPERIKKLADFQAVILHHALSKFPQVKRIVYSTCSVYPEENEHVVSRVLNKHPNFKLISAKELLNGLWTNSPSENVASITDKCLYAKPEKDLTNGFFIAVIERINSEDLDSNDKIKRKNKQKVRKNSECDMETNDKNYEHITQEINEKRVAVITDNEQDVSVSKKMKKRKKNREKTEESYKSVVSKKKHKKKKEKKSIAAEDEEVTTNTQQESETIEVEDIKPKQSKRKRKHGEKDNEPLHNNESNGKGKHKKIKMLDEESSSQININESKSGKHKKSKTESEESNKEATTNEEENVEVKQKKKKKKKGHSNLENNETDVDKMKELQKDSEIIETKKHKKKKELNRIYDLENCEKEQKLQKIESNYILPKKTQK